MLITSQNKLSEILTSLEKYHQVPSYQRCRDLLNAKRATFEDNLIANKRNKFARDIADYEKGTIFQWGKGRFKTHMDGDSQVHMDAGSIIHKNNNKKPEPTSSAIAP